MQNKSPIFLNCFSRGGSNILWNIFLTHPDVCSPIRETLEIFRTGLREFRLRRPTIEGYWLRLLTGQPRFMDQWHLEERHPISPAARAYLDKVLYRCKLRTLEDSEMCLKEEGVRYTREEVESSRLVAKNNNGLVFLSDILAGMYPDATFFGLVRSPFAVYESHKRRQIISNVEEFGRFYETLVQRMIADSRRLPNYHLIKFEDVLADPIGVSRRLYAQAGLDFTRVKKFRFKAKPHLTKDGQHTSKFEVGHHFWFTPEKVFEILEPNINAFQAGKLSPAERDTLLRIARKSIDHFDYASSRAVESTLARSA
jgi:hypothetical protein